MKKPFLLAMFVFVIAVSGCVIPGTDIIIPIPGFKTVTGKADVIVLKSLDAYPSIVSAGHKIRLIAYIENRGSRTVPVPGYNGFSSSGLDDIVVEIYDYCDGLFENIETANCPGGGSGWQGGGFSGGTYQTDCRIDKLLPKETKEIDWILTPNRDLKLETSCDLKVSVTYPHTTKSLSTITFINSKEMQRQLEQGTFRRRSSYVTYGEGPVKAYIKVIDQQPIPTSEDGGGAALVNLEVENRGSGFIANPDTTQYDYPVVVLDEINFGESEGGFLGSGSLSTGSCSFSQGDEIRLIQGSSAVKPCEIMVPTDSEVPKEQTRQLTVSISYDYEFRKAKKVTIKPQLGLEDS